MSDQNKVVFVYSSDYRKLYKKDVYNVLSYPTGFVMHFRYRLKWVSDDLRKNLPIEGNEVVMIAAIIINDDHEDIKFKFMPFRRGKVISIIKDGDTLHIYYELLKEWVLYDDSKGKDVNFYDDLIKQNDCPSNGKFMCFGNTNKFSFSKDPIAWVEIIERLVKFNRYKLSTFYRINNISELPGGKLLEVEEFDRLTRGFVLKKGKNYSIDITFNFGQNPPEKAKSTLFKFDTFENLKIIPKELLLGFRVDKKQFYLSVSRQSSQIRTYISTKIENSLEGPNLEIPIKIKRRKFIYILYLIIISTGLILLGLPWPFDTIGIILKLIGTGLTTLGTFLINYYTRWDS